ncbi:hypothetical protein LTR86_004771 [Recurvomyces mirabilis]|nr:hypothetical protein LTR86_004771 [Recurvomyces mirabilis]
MPKIRHLTLDGRHLEGGGQLLRTAICLSALTSTPLQIHHIRGNRSGGGGLKVQHLASVKWLAEACDARVEGGEKGSTDLVFEPGEGRGRGKGKGVDVGGGGLPAVFRKKTLPLPGGGVGGDKLWEARLEIGTAGSTGLALQAILPFILFTKLPGDGQLPVHLTLSGGTNVSGSPSYEYLSQVLLPMLKAIGLPEMKAVLHRRGWSQGGSSIGSLTIEIPARKNVVLGGFTLAPSDLLSAMRGPLRRPRQVTATFIAPTSCHAHLKQVLVTRAREFFAVKSDSTEGDENLPIAIRCADSGHEKRLYLIAVLTVPIPPTTPSDPTSLNEPAEIILASDWLYDKKISLKSGTSRLQDEIAEEMAQRVLTELSQEWRSGAYVDEHLRDQLVIFQALAKGRSSVHPGYANADEAGSGEGGGEGEGEGDGGGGLREPSLHTQTAEWVVNEILGADFDGSGGCEGVGFDGSEGIDWVRRVRETKRAKDVEDLSTRIDGVDLT